MAEGARRLRNGKAQRCRFQGTVTTRRQDHPPQAAGGDVLAPAGGDRVAVVAAFGDLGPAPAFQGLIDGQGQSALGGEGADQQLEHPACEFEGRPAGAVEDGVESAEERVVLVPGSAEPRRRSVGRGPGSCR